MDLELYGRTTLEIDVYQRDSDNLLYNPPLPATAGAAAPPIVNIGQMKNTGVDASLGFGGSFANGLVWDVSINASHYKNEIVRIDGQQDQVPGPVAGRAGTMVMNRVGHPIGAFYGFKVDGYYQTKQEIDELNATDRQNTGRAAERCYACVAPR